MKKAEKKHKLTDKQEMFCKEYLVDLNATRAAIRAGYSEKTAKDIACENLAKPYLQERIQELMANRAEKVTVTAENVLKSILDIRDTSTQKIALTDKEGNETGYDMLDKNAALKANELLGKHLVLFTDKVESKNLNINADIDTLSDEQLEQELKKWEK